MSLPHDFNACDAYAMRYDNTQNDSAPGENFRTKWAVTALTWSAALQQGIVNKPFEQATAADCQTIRHAMYWNALHCGQLPPGINYMAYSAGLLAGCGYIARTVQRIVGVSQDGVIGKATLQAVNRYGDKPLMDAIWAANRDYFASLGKLQFLHGWNIRNDQDIAQAYLMAGEQQKPPTTTGPAPAGGFPDAATDGAETAALNDAEEQRIEQGT